MALVDMLKTDREQIQRSQRALKRKGVVPVDGTEWFFKAEPLENILDLSMKNQEGRSTGNPAK
jgi:hypothetical protein